MKKRMLSGKRLFPVRRGRIISTARRQRMRDLCAVLLFLLLLPYVCSLLFGRNISKETGDVFDGDEQGIYVNIPVEGGRREIPAEEYLTGALAASIPVECQEETLKAQAVILRTMCVYTYQNMTDGGSDYSEGKTDRISISAEDIGQKYLDEQQLRSLWGMSYDANMEKINAAVSGTKELYMADAGRAVEPAYFWLSAGRTRSGEEVLGEAYAHLVSVECSHDIQADDYDSRVSITEEKFWRILGTDKQSGISLTRDSAGYVLWVEYGEEKMSGEKFRSLFSLNSSCFTLTAGEGKVEIVCRGVGHGLGFCQYDADRRAKEGMDYISLLKIYFQNIELESNVV